MDEKKQTKQSEAEGPPSLREPLVIPAPPSPAGEPQMITDPTSPSGEPLEIPALPSPPGEPLMITDPTSPAGEPLMIRAHIGHYKVLREIGSGGMGVVYLAERTDPFMHVAIKVIKAELAQPDVVQRFLSERQLLASLDHPNIARLLDGGATEDGLPYLVMEYIEGLSIAQFCDRHRLSIVERLRIFQQVCAAVEFAHRNLIVHLDLKPSNILVTSGGVPRLLDFGVARLLNPKFAIVPPADHGKIVLTPEYASPERVRAYRERDRREPVTTASDVYSLGVILYELLAGHGPYRASTHEPAKLVNFILEGIPERPSTAVSQTEEVIKGGTTIRITPEDVSWARKVTPEKLRRHLSGDLDSIVLMALPKEPERRYASVEALSEDIRRYLERLPVKARNGSAVYRAGKIMRRHPIRVVGAAVFTLFLVTFAVAMTLQRTRLAREQATTEKLVATLVDMFKLQDPSEAKGKAVKEKILDRGADIIHKDLKNKPEIQATLMHTVGNVYESLGLYDKAARLLGEALVIRRALGNESLDVARTMDSLAIVLAEKGDFTGAEGLFKDTLELRRKLLGNEHPEVAATMINLANVLYRVGERKKAEEEFREALALIRKLKRNQDRDEAGIMNNLANVLEGEGDYAQAEELNREALALRRKILGMEHLEVADSLDNLAASLMDRGDYDDAEARFHEALAMKQKLLGTSQHPAVARTMDGLACVLGNKGDYAGAKRLFRETLAIERELLGEEHPDVASTKTHFAYVLDYKGDYKEAEVFFNDAVTLRRKLVKSKNADVTDVAESLRGLGEVLTDEGRAERAEGSLREALQIVRKAFPQRHPEIAETESAFAACLIGLRKYSEAESLLLESYPILRFTRSDRYPETQRARRHLVELYEAWGKPEKAAPYRTAAAVAGPH